MKTEIGFTTAFIIGLLFKFLHLPGGSIIVILSLGILSILYSSGGFYFFSDKTIKKSNIGFSIAAGLFLSIPLLGILFKIQHYPGATIMLLVGSLVAPVFLVLTLVLKSKATEELKVYYQNMTTRTVAITFFTILLYLTPVSTLVSIQYWDDPEMVRLSTLRFEYPDNDEYQRQYEEYMLEKERVRFEEAQSE